MCYSEQNNGPCLASFLNLEADVVVGLEAR